MTQYYRPITQIDPARPFDAKTIAGGWTWFSFAERLERGRPSEIVPIHEVPGTTLDQLTRPRPDIASLNFSAPRLMGILNTTPDSFSDGGCFNTVKRAVAHADKLLQNGADIIDIGGESTRPGAEEVGIKDEISRTAPIINALRQKTDIPISIDTRKSDVAKAAVGAGADLINDVAAMRFDPKIGTVASGQNIPICLMHAQGDPATMQDTPHYEDVLLDVYDFLAEQIAKAVDLGIPHDQIIVDPGIGFGKTLDHNLALLKGLSLFHGLGCPILLGVSRKSFIGTLGWAPDPNDRVAGTISATLHGIRQGVQIHRIHDILPVNQAISVNQAITLRHT